MLVERAKGGDKEAFNTLYRIYITPVYRFAYSRLRNADDAEDIVQETFTKAYEAIGRYDDRGITLLPYLFTVARNLIINAGKKKKAEPMPQEDIEKHSGDMDPERDAIEGEERRAIYLALDKLPDADRSVIELRFFSEYSYAEIAERSGKREDAIRQQVARALKKLRMVMIDPH
jgi:RNA polymerase sigma-70 factor (ECF subfamily)